MVTRSNGRRKTGHAMREGKGGAHRGATGEKIEENYRAVAVWGGVMGQTKIKKKENRLSIHNNKVIKKIR